MTGVLAKNNPEVDRAAVTTVLAKQDPEIDDTVASILVERGNRVISEREAASKAEGVREGEAKGKSEAILALLSMRGIAVSEAIRARIMTCQEPSDLNRWFVRALQARSAEDVIAG